MVTYFGRTELAEVSGLSHDVLKALIQRRLVPTLLDDPKRIASTAFDALILTTADFYCRDGGYDRRFVANVLHQNLDELYKLARRIDAGEPGIVALIAQTEDRHCHVMGGAFRDVMAQLPSRMRSPARMCFVSMTVAAKAVRERARKANIDIGECFAMTEAEVAEIAALPFGRRSKRKKTKAKINA
jgi:hypothetical protein